MAELETNIDSFEPTPEPPRRTVGREDREKWAAFKWEFFRRSPEYSQSQRQKKKGWEKAEKNCHLYQRAVDVGYAHGKITFKNLETLDREKEDKGRVRGKQTSRKVLPRMSPAIDPGEKTIIIRIHLDRKKADIGRDVNHLLNLLDKGGGTYKLELKRMKSHWDVYDNYLRVYDLKKENPKLTWSEIAIIIFPQEVYKNTKRDKNLAMNSAKDKVRNYWRQAKKMIEEGGWKQI